MNTLDKTRIEDIVALTPMQEGILFQYLANRAEDPFFEQLSLVLLGEINVQRFRRAWQVVAQHNEMLRTVYRWEDISNPLQIVLKSTSLECRYHDLSKEREGEKKRLVAQIKDLDKKEGFDLQQVPFRVNLCKLHVNQYELIISHHHILYDGWSNGILLKEFMQNYRDLSRGIQPTGQVKTKFKEFVRYIRQQSGDTAEKFWRDYLEGPGSSPGSDLPPRRRLKKGDKRSAREFRVRLSRREIGRLEDFSRRHKISLAALFHTVWGLLIQQYNGSRDVVFDTTLSGRSAGIPGIEEMVGLFINTLPVRIRTVPEEGIGDLLSRTREHLQRCEEYVHIPRLVINEYLEKANREMLFDSVVVLENYPLAQRLLQSGGELKIGGYSITETTGHDITVIIAPFDPFEISFAGHGTLFDRKDLKRLCGHFRDMLNQVLNRPEGNVGEIALLTGEERRRIKREFIRKQELSRKVRAAEYAVPRHELDQRLVEIWSRVLRVDKEKIGIDFNFFSSGGHSLKASLLAAEIHREFKVRLPLAEVFNRPTIRELSEYISAADADIREVLEHSEKREYYAAASAQKRFYMLQQVEPDNTAYNVTAVLDIEGRLNKDRLQRCLEDLIRRHESFRTSFGLVDGETVQKIHRQVDFNVEYMDSDPGREKTEIIRNFVRPFDLAQVPLVRAGLAKVGEESHIFMLDIHHIVTDGVSMDVIIREFNTLYSNGELPLLKYHYKDFSRWQNRRLVSGELKQAEKFWLDELSGDLPLLNIPGDFPRSPTRSSAGDRVFFRLDEHMSRQLHEFIRASNTTMFIFLLAILNVLLFRYTGQEYFLIGTTVAGRDHPDMADLVGLFIETLVLGNRPAYDMTFAGFLHEVKENTLRAFQHREYPFGRLMKKRGTPEGTNLNMNPLFQVMLIVQNMDMAELKLPGLRLIPVPYHSRVSKVDLTVEAVEVGEEIRFHIEYSTDLFRRETIERLGGHFINVVTEAIKNPRIRLADMEMMDEGERQSIQETFAVAVDRYTADGNGTTELEPVQKLFAETVERMGDRVVMRYEDKDSAGNLQITYAELNQQVNVLAKMIEEL